MEGVKVEVTAAEPAEVDADVLALAAGGLRVRELDSLFEGRLLDAAAYADPVSVVLVGRELRAQRVAVVALEENEPEALRTAAARAGARAPGRRDGRLGARRVAPLRPVPAGAGGRRGRGPRRLQRGSLAGLPALAAVGGSSAQTPQLVVLRHEPSGAPERPRLALVGKAVTFDAGGYFLKPQYLERALRAQ